MFNRSVAAYAWRQVYRLVMHFLMPVLLLRLWLKGFSNPEYRAGWLQRLGYVPQRDSHRLCVWLHAVSVGEALAIAPLVRQLQRGPAPLDLIVSTTTPSGRAQVLRLYGNQVRHVYLPFDLPGCTRRALTRLRPDALVLVETEIWPELIHTCGVAQVPVLLVNARLSARSQLAYARLGAFMRETLSGIDFIAARSAGDARRFIALGASAERVNVAGNLKHDGPDARGCASAAARLSHEGPVWIAGSTHAGEEEAVLDAHLDLRSAQADSLLILAPRHPRRAVRLLEMCAARGLAARLHSEAAGQVDGAAVYVLDTLGELAGFYGQAQLAFVGGSLAALGGHNPFEPAIAGVPVLTGPHRANFESDYALLFQAKAAIEVEDGAALAQTLIRLMNCADSRAALAARASQVLMRLGGASERVARLIGAHLTAHETEHRPVSAPEVGQAV